MKKDDPVVVTPPTPVTVHDKLDRAMSKVDSVIVRMDGGRKCDTPTWSELHDCKRLIQEAKEMLQQGRRSI